MLKIDRVTKRLGQVLAVDGLSLDVPEGIVFGLLGPNGAGKTTLIRLLAGLTQPTSGQIEMFGRWRPGHPEVLHRIGYMPQQLALYPGLSVLENVLFYGRIYRMSERELKDRAEEVLRLVDLTDRRDSIVGTLSGGMIRRAMLATTMVHAPKLLILDEPTAGVDPLLRLKFWDWFGDLRERGTTILVTTHHISEAARCQRVVFMRSGRLIEDGTPSALMERYGAHDLEAAFVAATRNTAGDGEAADGAAPREAAS